MLGSLLISVDEKTKILNHYLSLCDACDYAIADQTSSLYAELSNRSALSDNSTEEKTLRHCTIITQVYGIYEWFSEAALAHWLSELPKYQKLSNLTEKIQNSYRSGMSRIIHDIESKRYSHLSLVDVLEKYLDALRARASWEFVDDALIFHSANLRRDTFGQLFGSVGLDNIWKSLEESAAITSHMTEIDSDMTLEQKIHDLVDFRNQAAHGRPDEILGTDSLKEWVRFMEIFCRALAETVTHRIVRMAVDCRPDLVIGTVSETYSNNIVVAICSHGELSVGQTLYFLRNRDCVEAAVESLQINDVDHTVIRITKGPLEVGIKTTKKVGMNSKIVFMNIPQ